MCVVSISSLVGFSTLSIQRHIYEMITPILETFNIDSVGAQILSDNAWDLMSMHLFVLSTQTIIVTP